MTKTEYVLFIVTDGSRMDRPAYVESNTGYAVGSPENELICQEVERVSELWVKEGQPDTARVLRDANRHPSDDLP